jgi:hypothetical protein
MVIHNESARPTKQLRPLINFCKPFFNHHALVSLFMYTADRNGELTGGWADKYHLGVVFTDGVPSSVLLRLSKGMKYPTASVYRKSVGQVTFDNWQEEFLFVLAHELRHIDQFWSFEPPRHYEVDAEKFALEVLAEYREKIRYKRAA